MSPRGSARVVARVALARSGDLTRLDILSVEASMAPVQLGGLVVVVDARTKSLTVWNERTHTYATQPLPFASAPASNAFATPASIPTRGERSGIADLDLFALDVHLLGRRTIATLPSTGVRIDMKLRRRGTKNVIRVTGTSQIADDFAFLPLVIDVNARNGSLPVGTFTYAVDSFERALPYGLSFDVPAGYRAASSLIDVVLSSGGAPPAAAPAVQSSPASAATPTSHSSEPDKQ